VAIEKNTKIKIEQEFLKDLEEVLIQEREDLIPHVLLDLLRINPDNFTHK
jgi:hypothetical protein